MFYEIDIAGLKRKLPLCKVSDDLYIGAFVMFGDVEITVHAAAELLKRAPEYDYIIAPEAKSIPLLYEMARQSGAERYFLARKGPKAYMSGVFEVNVKSITTMAVQKLVIDKADAEFIKGKRMLILDDVISTGESLHATEELVRQAGGIVAGKMAVLAEGDAADRDDIIVLQKLPVQRRRQHQSVKTNLLYNDKRRPPGRRLLLSKYQLIVDNVSNICYFILSSYTIPRTMQVAIIR